MSEGKTREPLSGIEELKGQLAVWRQSRITGQAMPEELWKAAAELARRHSVFAVSRSLGLEFNKLKAHAQGRAPAPKKRSLARQPKRQEGRSQGPQVGG